MLTHLPTTPMIPSSICIDTSCLSFLPVSFAPPRTHLYTVQGDNPFHWEHQFRKILNYCFLKLRYWWQPEIISTSAWQGSARRQAKTSSHKFSVSLSLTLKGSAITNSICVSFQKTRNMDVKCNQKLHCHNDWQAFLGTEQRAEASGQTKAFAYYQPDKKHVSTMNTNGCFYFHLRLETGRRALLSARNCDWESGPAKCSDMEALTTRAPAFFDHARPLCGLISAIIPSANEACKSLFLQRRPLRPFWQVFSHQLCSAQSFPLRLEFPKLAIIISDNTIPCPCLYSNRPHLANNGVPNELLGS